MADQLPETAPPTSTNAATVRVRMIASRRSDKYTHRIGDTPALPAELANEFLTQGAAIPYVEPPAQAPRLNKVGKKAKGTASAIEEL